MDTMTKLEKLKAIKEQYEAKQALLQKAIKLREAAEATHIATLLEADLNKAEQILSGEDVVEKLQGMVEDLAQLSAKQLLTLSDDMKETFGPEAAMQFEHAAQDAMTAALSAVRGAKDAISTALLQLQGKLPQNDMAADDMGSTPPAADNLTPDVNDADLLGGVDSEAGDDFGGADAASGPEDEPLGRALKAESAVSSKSALTENFDLAAAGRKLLESESMESLLDWVLEEAASAMPQPEFKNFARKLATQAAKNPEKTAGWVGKKKYGAAAMAQLVAPTVTAAAGPTVESTVVEGKTFRKGDEDSDKAETFKKRDNERKMKQRNSDDDDLDEGKSYRKNPDDEEDSDKASAMKDRAGARERKMKQRDEVTEAQKTAMAMAKVIEANILTKGRGLAAQVVKQYGADALAEGEGQSVMEAFEELFGMRPAAFSVQLAAQLGEGAPLSTQDKANQAKMVGQIATKMSTDKTMAGKPVSAGLQGLSPTERTTANKIIQNAKADGKPVNKVGDLMAATGAGDDEDTNESIAENINAAHWPTDAAGQYKGEPMSTDYQKLKPVTGEHEPKAEAPGKHEATGEKIKDEAAFPKKAEKKAEAPKAEKADKPAGKPWEKKEEPKAEAESEEDK